MKRWIVLIGLLVSLQASAQESAIRLKSQALYLPIYSHMYYGNRFAASQTPKTLLSALVSIRNTDAKRTIRITVAKYYDTNGRFLRDYLASPVVLAPFGTTELFIEQHDESGGSGANFLIHWESDEPVNPPLIQAIHANMDSGKATIITTQAVPITP